MAVQLPSKVPKKIDRSKRFNTPDYKRKVNAARRYKRERPKILENPERSATIRHWLISTAAIIVVGGIVYLVYFAPLLKINSLVLKGANGDLAPQIQNQFNQFINSSRYALPQKNILLFSSASFATELRKDGLVEPSVLVKKQLWHSVKVTVTQRVPEFVMVISGNTGGRLLLSNDGYVTSILQPTDTEPSGLALITDDSNDDANNLPAPASAALNQRQMQFIVFMQNNLSADAQVQAASYEISSRQSEYLIVHASGGYQLMFDMGMDPKIAMQRLQTVLQQPAEQNRASIAYIDLRFDPKVYTCAVGQPCATLPYVIPTMPVPTPPQSSTTPMPTTALPPAPNIPNSST
jgi:cell division septal protein FtsQ